MGEASAALKCRSGVASCDQEFNLSKIARHYCQNDVHALLYLPSLLSLCGYYLIIILLQNVPLIAFSSDHGKTFSP